MTEKRPGTSAQAAAEAMVGQKYGCLAVTSAYPSTKYGYTRWFVRCHCTKCGAEYERIANQVRKFSADYCRACAPSDPKTHYAPERDLSGRKFQNLLVLRRSGPYLGSNRTLWLCRCLLCGREVEVAGFHLRAYKSCGCLSAQAREAGKAKLREGDVEGTSVYSISPDRALNRNSTTGHRGVALDKHGKFRAYINFRRKQYHLGTFSDLDSAVAARKAAEAHIYGDFLSWYSENHGTAAP